ncbi:PadR family transcriptional regulator [Leifsonia sp. H3M29-4]|uniref:PadR family transcriptional regulator n=1 Tax=Salinibacterium metalliresistens TaxID=3031321 RepID=UPI0023DC5AE8|nr:PadR family transcriptional regulator [Salinibacterium metalliresistens]MDF1477557.1 PadR family transcriptional regulator [Salinibacterium metalliresistens]
MTPPVFAHGHLRLYLLSLLAASDTGMHGYELIQALGDRFGGTYVPSAGTIYPRLAKLESEGLVTKVADGRKTVYAITDAGRAELTARESELDDIESDVTDSVRRLADEVRASVNDAMRTLRADLAAAAREARSEARQAGRSARAEQTSDATSSRLQLQAAEAALHEFRDALRSELRQHVARGNELGDDTVQALRDGLAALRTDVTARLHR